MKDLYTFDADPESARATYNQVRAAYHDFFQALRMPFLTAKADSGNMGGTLSQPHAEGESANGGRGLAPLD